MSSALQRAEPTHPQAADRRWIGLAFIALAQLMTALDATIVSIALPWAQRALGASDAERQWVITAYTLAFGGLLPRRTDRGYDRTPARIPYRSWRFCSGLGYRRLRAKLHRPARGPSGSGRLRGTARADSPLAACGDVHAAARTSQSFRCLRCDRGKWRRTGPSPGRRPHGICGLALVPLRQRSDRARGGDRRPAGTGRRERRPWPAI